MTLERLWAGWRMEYVSDPAIGTDEPMGDRCVICRLDDAPDDSEALVLERTESTITVMNLYPYTSGHTMVSPRRHTPDLDDLSAQEAAALMEAIRRNIVAIKTTYAPDGLNVGVNQRAAAGAGVPGHLHSHVVPRWGGDTNFVTSIAEARVLPEDIRSSYERLRSNWPVM